MQALTRLMTAFITMLVSGGALAAEDLGAAAKACRSESDQARRLACYDRAVDRTTAGAKQAAEPAGAASSATKPAAAAAATATAAAGSTAPAAPAPAAQGTPAAPSATVAAPPGQSPQADFGLERQKAYEEDQRREEQSRAAGELRATILEIEKRMDGLLTFTLDNGQIWRQNTPDSRFRASTGDRVLIQPGSLNSFILSTQSKKSTRVTRVK
jgi:hypothetical protein